MPLSTIIMLITQPVDSQFSCDPNRKHAHCRTAFRKYLINTTKCAGQFISCYFFARFTLTLLFQHLFPSLHLIRSLLFSSDLSKNPLHSSIMNERTTNGCMKAQEKPEVNRNYVYKLGKFIPRILVNNVLVWGFEEVRCWLSANEQTIALQIIVTGLIPWDTLYCTFYAGSLYFKACHELKLYPTAIQIYCYI